jgi:hypothetical protein
VVTPPCLPPALLGVIRWQLGYLCFWL